MINEGGEFDNTLNILKKSSPGKKATKHVRIAEEESKEMKHDHQLDTSKVSSQKDDPKMPQKIEQIVEKDKITPENPKPIEYMRIAVENLRNRVDEIEIKVNAIDKILDTQKD